MKLIVGLGNPGTRYTATRHNVGWRVLDAIAAKEGLHFKPGKGDYAFASKPVDNVECVFLKPMTFMNDSGVAVVQAVNTFGVNVRYDLLVILDEFQLPLGAVRLKAMGGDGGHNGMASVVYHLQTNGSRGCGAGSTKISKTAAWWNTCSRPSMQTKNRRSIRWYCMHATRRSDSRRWARFVQ